ncbi:glycosyltransferase family 2 protein [Scytonema sp. PRP1]|uniref:glycosyltransferase family 2 protein n=1 Tax=Scytonema sp. PRP1 TaxID=3120513 RepID=UPI002FD1F1DB
MVCDDGSTDNSCEVIESYAQKDSRIKLIRKQNGGISTALNTAYKESIRLLSPICHFLQKKFKRMSDPR